MLAKISIKSDNPKLRDVKMRVATIQGQLAYDSYLAWLQFIASLQMVVSV